MHKEGISGLFGCPAGQGHQASSVGFRDIGSEVDSRWKNPVGKYTTERQCQKRGQGGESGEMAI